jgi:hypothetical protein
VTSLKPILDGSGTFGRETITIDDGIVVWQMENTRFLISRLWTRSDAADFYPTKAEIEQAYIRSRFSNELSASSQPMDGLNFNIPSTASPSLSKPAASPTGFDTTSPKS